LNFNSEANFGECLLRIRAKAKFEVAANSICATNNNTVFFNALKTRYMKKLFFEKGGVF
jgi:hypothetical protein